MPFPLWGASLETQYLMFDIYSFRAQLSNISCIPLDRMWTLLPYNTLEDVFLMYLSYWRFHPSCMGMTIEEAKKLDQFLCSDCSSDDDTKRSLNSFPVSPAAETKVRTLLLFDFIVRKYLQEKWKLSLSNFCFWWITLYSCSRVLDTNTHTHNIVRLNKCT